jgi:hypothetical protein
MRFDLLCRKKLKSTLEQQINMPVLHDSKNPSSHKKVISCLLLCLSIVGISAHSSSQQAPAIPAINADLGSCSVLLTLKDGSGKPVPGATVRVRIAYGFMGVRKLDLETATNTDGKVRFEGIPENLKHALFFRASKDKLAGTAFYDPSKNCAAEHTVVMLPKKDQTDQEESDSSSAATDD